MTKPDRIDNKALLNAGLELMEKNGKKLERAPSRGRSLRYKISSTGETVRVRTCNDHILIVLADRASKDAHLNIEGTDRLLIVMPENERTHGKVICYLVPTDEAVAQARQTHQEWLNSRPNTKGDNRTWNLWFADNRYKSSGFAKKWAKYRLPGTAFTTGSLENQESSASNIKAEVDDARRRIAEVAGVAPDAVKISIDFGL